MKAFSEGWLRRRSSRGWFYSQGRMEPSRLGSSVSFALVIALAVIVGSTAPVSSRDCNAEFPRISANRECNPDMANSKNCRPLMRLNGKYPAPTKEWQACLKVIADCYVDIDRKNSILTAQRARCRQEVAQAAIDKRNADRDKARVEAFIKKCKSRPQLDECKNQFPQMLMR